MVVNFPVSVPVVKVVVADVTVVVEVTVVADVVDVPVVTVIVVVDVAVVHTEWAGWLGKQPPRRKSGQQLRRLWQSG